MKIPNFLVHLFVKTLNMIMIMIEIQYSDTAFLLMVNPRIPHQNNSTACPSYINNRLKRRHFVASYVQLIIQQYKSTTVNFSNQSSHYENY